MKNPTAVIIVKLSRYWAVSMVCAMGISLSVSYYHSHPPPSQAVVDKVYYENHSLSQLEGRTLFDMAAALQAAIDADKKQTNAPTAL